MTAVSFSKDSSANNKDMHTTKQQINIELKEENRKLKNEINIVTEANNILKQLLQTNREEFDEMQAAFKYQLMQLMTQFEESKERLKEQHDQQQILTTTIQTQTNYIQQQKTKITQYKTYGEQYEKQKELIKAMKTEINYKDTQIGQLEKINMEQLEIFKHQMAICNQELHRKNVALESELHSLQMKTNIVSYEVPYTYHSNYMYQMHRNRSNATIISCRKKSMSVTTDSLEMTYFIQQRNNGSISMMSASPYVLTESSVSPSTESDHDMDTFEGYCNLDPLQTESIAKRRKRDVRSQTC